MSSPPPTAQPQISSPLPTVSSTLDPYIRSRSQVHHIRTLITSALTSSPHLSALTKSNEENAAWKDTTPSLSQLLLGYPPGKISLGEQDDDVLTGSIGLGATIGGTSTAGYMPVSVRGYMTALTALRRAQVRYNGIKRELEELKGIEEQESKDKSKRRRETYSLQSDPVGAAATAAMEEAKGTTNVQSRISALRLSRKRARLDAVAKAVDALDSLSNNPLQRKVKSHVKASVGELPEPPSSTPSVADADSETGSTKELESLVFELKKALVLSGQREKKARDEEQSARDRVNRVLARMDTRGQVPSSVKLEAMAKAREDLVAWMEGELAKVAGGVADDEDDDEEHHEGEENGHHADEDEKEMTLDEVNLQVQELYQIYLSARKDAVARIDRLLATRSKISSSASHSSSKAGTAAASNQSASNPSSPTRLRKNTLLQQDSGPTLSATEILPHLPTLINSSRAETSLMQQTSHLRKAINIASSDTLQTLQKLAGESHLVPPGTADVAAWEKAASEFARDTEGNVRESVKEGNERVKGAKGALGDMGARRKALEMVKDRLT
jgi:hypothetical protein